MRGSNNPVKINFLSVANAKTITNAGMLAMNVIRPIFEGFRCTVVPVFLSLLSRVFLCPAFLNQLKDKSTEAIAKNGKTGPRHLPAKDGAPEFIS